MRNWAFVGVAIALFAGSAWAEPIATTYKSVKEVCLFSPTVPPANSTLAIQSVGEGTFHGPDHGYDFVRDFKTGFVGQGPAASGRRIGSSDVATAAISLKRVYEPSWHFNIDGKDGDIPGATDRDGANFDFRGNAEGGSAEYFRSRFKVSGVSGVGVERNGFVAGFNFKY